jgi:gamma-glutamylcyclotransferase
MKFFLYGDSLNPTQLKRRAPEHQFLMLATLPEYTIQFSR